MLITFPSSTRRWRLNTSLLQNAACCSQFREVWQEFLLVNKGSVSDHLLYDATKGFISNTSISFALHDQFRACSRVANLPKLHVFLQNEIKKWSSMITFKRYPSLLRCIQTENHFSEMEWLHIACEWTWTYLHELQFFFFLNGFIMKRKRDLGILVSSQISQAVTLTHTQPLFTLQLLCT